MKYFERTNRFANILFVMSAIFFIAMCILATGESVVGQIFHYSNGNYLRVGILFVFYFTAFLFSAIIGIALKCIVRDAKEELDVANKKSGNKELEQY